METTKNTQLSEETQQHFDMLNSQWVDVQDTIKFHRNGLSKAADAAIRIDKSLRKIETMYNVKRIEITSK